jgi:hypothetical protein
MSEGPSGAQVSKLAAGHRRRPPLVWAGYAACAWGLVFGGISFYWALGGTLGADTVGSSVEQMATAHGHAALWITGFMKVLGALLALALVQPRGQRLPRPLLLVLGWGATAVLTLYGGVNVAGEALTASGLVRPGAVDWKPLLWHLYVWDMSFLVWGILFGFAAWYHTRATSRSS